LDIFTPQDKKEIIKAAFAKGYFIDQAPENIKNDKDVVLEAVKRHLTAYSFASEALKKDKEIVLAAINLRPRIIVENINLQEFNDNDRKEIALALVTKDGYLLKYINLQDFNENDRTEIVGAAETSKKTSKETSN
jgi:hypothetical protein